jgi:hypothetical protein
VTLSRAAATVRPINSRHRLAQGFPDISHHLPFPITMPTIESPLAPRAKPARQSAHPGGAARSASANEPLLISTEGKPDVKSLNLKAAVNRVLDAQGQQLATLPVHKAMVLQREVLRALREQIEATDAGSLNIPWLGNFKVHPARPAGEGAPARARRVTFTPARNRPADAMAGSGADATDSGHTGN